MRRLGLPVCACAAILLWWLHGPEGAPRRTAGALGAALDPQTTAGAATQDPPAAALSEVTSVRREAASEPILEGTVVDPEGRGVLGVTLTAAFGRSGNSHYPHHLGFDACRTDGAGRFRMDVPARAEWASVRIDAPGWVEPPTRTVRAGGTTLGAGTPADARALDLVQGEGWPRQRIVLERGETVEGVVESAEGIRLPDVRVEAEWGDGRLTIVHADEHGRFSIVIPAAAVLTARARPDEWIIPHSKPPFPWEGRAPRFAEVLEGDAEAREGPVAPGTSGLRMVLHETLPLDLRVRGPEGVLTGHLTARVKSPVQGSFAFRLFVRDGSLEYEIPRLLPGTYEIEVEPDDEECLAARVIATLPGAPADVSCPRSFTIDGILEGDDAKDFGITWTGPCNEGWRTVLAQSPEFSLRVGDGVGDLYARREGDPRYALAEGCRPGRGVVRLTLEEGRTIGGRVEGIAGLDTRCLAVRAVRGLLDQYARVGPDGSFSVVGLPPGSFRVELVTRGWGRGGLADRWLHDARDDVPAGTDDVRLRVRLPATDPGAGGS